MKVKSKWKKVLGVCALLSALALLACVSVGMVYVHSDRNLQRVVQQTGPYLLYDVVHNACVPDQRFLGTPAPCQLVHLGDDGYAVLRDVRGNKRLLLAPTVQIAGIESESILRDGAPNYFADAWLARTILEAQVHQSLARDQIALAVNPKFDRSQDQLHIHIGCVLPRVRKILNAHQSEISNEWAPFPHSLHGVKYQAMLVTADDLNRINPFRVLADELPGAKERMAYYTLAVIGTTLPNGDAGFILLAAAADPSKNIEVHGEDLLAPGCSN